MPNLVVVVGASSSGRTSVVNQYCSSDGSDYFRAHIDEFILQLPPGMWERCRNSDEGWTEIGLAFNEHLFSRLGNHEHVIADAFYKTPTARKHLFTKFDRKDVFLVQLFCELEELERRESIRGNRRLGLARSQFDLVYAFTDYDLRIDSTSRSVSECTKELGNAVASWEATQQSTATENPHCRQHGQ